MNVNLVCLEAYLGFYLWSLWYMMLLFSRLANWSCSITMLPMCISDMICSLHVLVSNCLTIILVTLHKPAAWVILRSSTNYKPTFRLNFSFLILGNFKMLSKALEYMFSVVVGDLFTMYTAHYSLICLDRLVLDLGQWFFSILCPHMAVQVFSR